MKINLPEQDGAIQTYLLQQREDTAAPAAPPPFNRIAYAAAHVVVDPRFAYDPWGDSPPVDWDTTLAFREYLYGLGFKVAEAMDTAQRGMGIGWPTASESLAPSSRANTSTAPPAANGTIRRTGLFG